jgi:hypothetical protein
MLHSVGFQPGAKECKRDKTAQAHSDDFQGNCDLHDSTSSTIATKTASNFIAVSEQEHIETGLVNFCRDLHVFQPKGDDRQQQEHRPQDDAPGPQSDRRVRLQEPVRATCLRRESTLTTTARRPKSPEPRWRPAVRRTEALQTRRPPKTTSPATTKSETLSCGNCQPATTSDASKTKRRKIS